MSYAFVQDVPANTEVYWKIRTKLGDTPPPGLISHVAIEHDGGLRYVDVWDSEDSWRAFHDTTLFPAVSEVLAGQGIEPNEALVTREAVTCVDAWVAPQPVG
jgi:hypothetical protein